MTALSLSRPATPTRVPWLHLALAASFAIAALVAGSGPAAAQGVQQAAESADGAQGSPFRGSLLVYRNSATINSLDKSEELTWNPYYAMSLTLMPQYWLTDKIFLRASTSIIHEFTNSDETTDRNESQLTDTNLSINANLWKLDGLGIIANAGLDFRLPTSKWSQANTMVLGITPRISLLRHFDVLSGLYVSYGFGFTHFFNRFTTTELDSNRIPDCGTSAIGCDSFAHNGVRNPRWRMAHSAALLLMPLDWLQLSASAAVLQDTLYDEYEAPEVSFVPQQETDTREWMVYGLEVAVQPTDAWAFALVASTFNPQLAPDSTYYAPFLNRFTTIGIDVRLNVAALLDGPTKEN